MYGKKQTTLNHVIRRFFSEAVQNNIDIVNYCRTQFSFELTSNQRNQTFEANFYPQTFDRVN